MTVRSSGNITRLVLILLILSGIGSSAFSQQNISGNIINVRGANKYPHTAVTAIPAANKLTVSNPAGFFTGDTVLVIQMQGVGIYTSPYGGYGTKLGEPGLWEFLIVMSVSGNDITFSNNLKHSYDIKGSIQVIRVPYFTSNATVTGNFTCDPWNPVTKSGGVVALIVGNTLTLNANIDVTGSGLKGGNADSGDGICQTTNATYQLETYADSYTNAGFKGEGIAIHNQFGTLLFPSNAKGKGANFTGGGGGNGNYSGGGGGSHRGTGGTGGYERNTCIPVFGGGSGGYQGQFPVFLINRIFMGGGGGASTRSGTGTTGPGGNGGGIVIIIANTIAGNGGKILAKGGDGGNGGGTGPSGAGGGGGGGTIALSVLNYSGSVDAVVEGGKGGDNIGRLYGEGGGGGAGLIWLTVDNAVIKPFMSGGAAGTSDNQQASAGGNGEKRTGFNPNLNGFLFNSVRSSVTGTQIDASCSNMIPPKLLGTLPVGGTAPYTVTWERSADNFTTSNVVASGVSLWDYTPVLDDTLKRSGPIYFRRTITDSSVPTQLVDQSLPVIIQIQPSIKRNYVGPPDTICFAQNPPAVGSMTALLYGTGVYTYKWMVSTVNGSSGFAEPANSHTSESYTPQPALTLDSWYRRTVYSGKCVDSSGVVKIKVLSNIGNNAITSALSEEICDGSSFSPVTATTTPALTGGDGSYKYKWVSSLSSWGAAPDASSGTGYNPVASSFPLGTTVTLRRVVFSGAHDVCKDTTTIVTSPKITRWPVIINNNIIADQAIGYDSVPQLLTENPAPGMTGGSGVYSYTWQIGPAWGNAPLNFSLKNYQAGSLQTNTTFRRLVNSSACSSISNIVTITVYSPITNNSIAINIPANDTIATGTSPGLLTGTMPTGGSGVPGDFSFKWYFSTTGTFGPADSIPGARSQNYTPGNLTASGSVSAFYYRRDASSPKAPNEKSTYKSNIIKVVVLPVLQNFNILGSNPKCSGLRPDWLKGAVPVSGGDAKYKYTWQDSTSGHDFADIPGFVKCDSANYKPPVLTSGAAYRRIVYSTANNFALQSATSNIARVTVYQRPSGSIVSTGAIKICDNGTPTAVPVTINLSPLSQPWTVVLSDSLGGTTSHTVTSLSSPLIVNPSTPSSKKLRYEIYSVTDVHNCASPAASFTGFQRVVVYRQPVANAGADVPQICGANIRLNATAAVGSGSWTWKKLSTATGSGNSWFANSTDPLTKVKVDSLTAAWEAKNSYRFYWLNVNGICSSRDSVDITFDKRIDPIVFSPTFNITSNPDRIDTLPSYPTPVGTGIWEPLSMVKDGNVAYNLQNGDNIFTYIVTNDACSKTGQYTITWEEIKIPKGFSPNNGDDINNLYEITGLDLDANNVTFKIINSAGSEVFYADNNSWTLWDGTRKGVDLPEGTYYYLLTVISKRDAAARRDFKGYLILKRKSYQ